MGMYAMLGRVAPSLVDEIQRTRPDSLELPALIEAQPDHVWLGKGWHFLHYALCGEAWGGEPPLAWAVLGPAGIGGDLGSGPARLLTPRQVERVSAALPKRLDWAAPWLTTSALTAAEIYPNAWETLEADDLRGWLEEADQELQALAALYRAAAKARECVVCILS